MHTHTHRTLILKHVVMLFLPARFVFMFMLVIKRFQTWAEWSEWEGARGRESEKKQYLKPDFFFDKFAISRTFMECLRIQRPYIHLHSHSYMCGKMHLHLFLWATTKNCNLLYLFLLNSGSQPFHAMPCYMSCGEAVSLKPINVYNFYSMFCFCFCCSLFNWSQ